MTIAAEHRRDYFERLAPPDRLGAVDLVLDLHRSGAGVGDVVEDVLAPAQVEVGAFWQRNEWSIGMEHAASAVTDAALSALSFAADRERPVGDRGRVLVACVEGEWHSIPARMVSETLRDDGFDVAFLGASAPGEEIARYAEAISPVAVALSCAVPLAFDAMRRCIDAIHDAGYPVIVGGRAFDAAGRRAVALGADACVADGSAAAAILDDWRSERPRLGVGRPVPDAVRALEAERDTIVTVATSELAERFVPMQTYSDLQRARTYEDLHYILGFASSAVLVDDPSVFEDFVVWLLEVLDARNVPSIALALGIATLARHIDSPVVLDLLRRGAELSGHADVVPTA